MKSSHSFRTRILSVTLLSKKRKYEDKNRGFETELEEQFVFLERNQNILFLYRTLLNAS
jgi:hypothetical protein